MSSKFAITDIRWAYLRRLSAWYTRVIFLRVLLDAVGEGS